MKIYFAGSIRGGRNDVSLYGEIIDYLGSFGEVLTEHIGDLNLTVTGDDGTDDRFIHDRDLEWLLLSDVLVAEVTQVSMGVGYEIGRAVGCGKKVLCLNRPSENKRLSAMIAGCGKIELGEYQTFSEAKAIIKDYFERNFIN